MSLKKLFIIKILLFCTTVFAQVIPFENAVLNYTSVYFQQEKTVGATRYTLVLMGENDAARKELHAKIPAFWMHDLSWGHSYKWQINAYGQNNKLLSSREHHFRIMNIDYQSFDEVRMTLTDNVIPQRHSGGLILVDYTRTAYDRAGKLVWTLPMIEGLVDEKTNIRDMKITADNTVTFLTIPVPLETDHDGNVLWKAPYPLVLGKDTIVYHHEFTKTARGTYMVLGDKKVLRKLQGQIPAEVIQQDSEIQLRDSVYYKRILLAILLEFDKAGNLLWSWDANNYISDADLVYKKNKRGMPLPATHANAFKESPDGEHVFIGFRDLSRIIKVHKRTGKVVMSYGEKYPSGEAVTGDGLFKHQHDANITSKGTVYILNNNGALSPEGVSSIIEFREKPAGSDSLLLWKFSLDFDTLSKGKSLNGGNVNVLPNGNVLLCGGALNRIFEVTRRGEVVWDAFFHARGKKDTLWQPMSQYRCSWTPLLKRFYFIAELETEKNESAERIRIYNTGNTEDSYEINVINGQNQVQPLKKTISILPGHEYVESLQTLMIKGKKMIQVRSVNSGRVLSLAIN